MNRHHRRAEAASGRKPVDRAEVIRLAHDFLANTAAPTVTGATVFMPDGTSFFISAEDARKLHGKTKPDGAT
jgi:hypothetical protein